MQTLQQGNTPKPQSSIQGVRREINMSDLTEILATIRKGVDQYEDLKLEDTEQQSDILRTLTCNLFYLEAHRVKAHNDWHTFYFESKAVSNAAKEREADLEIKELYMIRRIMTSGYKVVDAIRSTISIHKKER